MNDDAQARAKLRELFWRSAVVKSKVVFEKEEAAAKFKDYFDCTEPLAKIPSHRMLAIRRGESENLLMMRIHPPEEEALGLIEPIFVTGKGPAADQVRLAVGEHLLHGRSPYQEACRHRGDSRVCGESA